MRTQLFLLLVYALIQIQNLSGMFSKTEVHQTVNVNSQPAAADSSSFSFYPGGLISGTTSFLSYNKYTLLMLGLLSGYGYVCYTLVKANNILQSGRSWSAWKHHIEFSDLALTPQDDLARELLNDIQRQYINYENPTDFVSPLSHFAQDLEKENRLLNAYIKIGDIIIKCHATLLFPINADLIETARKRLERLSFVRHVFISWSAHHNLQQNSVIKNVIRRVRKMA
jgi:hypothetical protein